MKTLDRYILGRVSGRFLLLLVVFLGVVVGGQLGTFIGRGAPPEALLPIIPAALLLALPIAVPLAVATALLVAVGGMVRAGEFQALAAAGVDPRRVILRMWPFVAVMALFAGILAHIALPFAIRDIRANKGRILQAAIATQVANLKPIWDRDGISAWADNVQGRQLTDVYIRRVSAEGDFAAYAPRASWSLTTDGIQFALEDVRLVEVKRSGDLITGEAARYVIQRNQGDGLLQTEPDAMSTPDVIRELRTAPRSGPGCDRFNNARLALHLRLYLPVALFCYALFAVGLALVFATSEGLAAVAITVVVVALATYPAIGFVKTNANAQQMDPGFLLWTPGLLLAALGWWMLRRPQQARDLCGRPVALVVRLVRALGALVIRLIRRIRPVEPT